MDNQNSANDPQQVVGQTTPSVTPSEPSVQPPSQPQIDDKAAAAELSKHYAEVMADLKNIPSQPTTIPTSSQPTMTTTPQNPADASLTSPAIASNPVPPLVEITPVSITEPKVSSSEPVMNQVSQTPATPVIEKPKPETPVPTIAPIPTVEPLATPAIPELPVSAVESPQAPITPPKANSQAPNSTETQ